MPGARLYGDGWQDPPVPKDRAFVLRVISELRLADNAARDEAGLPRRHIPMPPRCEEKSVEAVRVPDGCAGCGCPLDGHTPGCHNCDTRHRARMVRSRLHGQLERVCRLIENAFP